MEVVFDKKSNVEGSIKIIIKNEDYQQEVDNAVKDYAKKAKINGFRPGKVPVGYIRKMYGTSFLSQKVAELVDKELRGYIVDNKIEIVGEPLANEEMEKKGIDWEEQTNFEFVYDIGFVDSKNINTDQSITLTKYEIEIREKDVDKLIETAKDRFATRDAEAKIITDNTEIQGLISSNGKDFPTAPFFPRLVEGNMASQLMGKGENEEITFTLAEDKKLETLNKIIDVTDEVIKAFPDKINFKIESVIEVTLPEVDVDFFKKVFPNMGIDNEASFREEIKKMLKINYEEVAQEMFESEALTSFVKEVKPDLPEDFLANFFMSKNMSEEEIKKNLPAYLKEIQWEVLVKVILDKNKITIEKEAIEEKCRELVRKQFHLSEGQNEIDEETMQQFVNNFLYQDKEGKKYAQIRDTLRREIATKHIIKNATITTQKTNWDEFELKSKTSSKE